MNLIVDIGNSSTKIAMYDNGEKVSASRIIDLTHKNLEEKLRGLKISRAIISSVRSLPPFVSDLISANIPEVCHLSHKTRLPFKIAYDTPETLGPDRIAGVAGAFSMFPLTDLLVIDAGTAITYDFLSEGIYRGGNISPGLNMRFSALNQFTGKLPLISIADDFTNPGKNTRDAILAGVITGITYEINEYIRTFEKKRIGYKIIMTGGDSEFLRDRVNLQFTYIPDIVIDGLNFILEYNAV